MATKALTLLRAAHHKASLASRGATAAAAAASHAARRMASRSPRADPKNYPNRSLPICIDYDFPTMDDYDHLPDDSKTPTDKDLESDEAVWALYERWCKAFDKKRDPAEMARRFKIFRYHAEDVHSHNTDVPEDPMEAAICLRKRRDAKLLISKGEDVSNFDDCHLPSILGPLADGGDPFLRECDYELLKHLEKREGRRATEDVTVE